MSRAPGRYLKDKDGNVTQTEAPTSPHPNPAARDAKGARLDGKPETEAVAKPAQPKKK